MSKRHSGFVHLICALCLALLLCPFAAAQTTKQLARKFDEFGDIQASDLIARLDNLAVNLQNDANTRAFLVVYRTRRDLPGLSSRYAQRMKSYMVHTRGISPERVITVDGGEASCLTQELWIVEPGGTPEPRNDAYSNSYEPSAYKFDEHYYASPRTPEAGNYWQDASEYPLGYLEAFGQELQKHPRAYGYLIAYAAISQNKRSVSRRMLRMERDFLVKEFGIKPARIKTIAGGYRERSTMELWIAQEGAGVPIISSYRYSLRRGRHH